MAINPGDGIYETRSHWVGDRWPENRRVYIQGSTVRLVNYIAFGDTEPGFDLFDFNFFFEANTLGPKVSDLPENFNIRERE